ncbi:tyrosine--tRNA ligase [Buchnera aphidicola (Ceratoglyphina bambusae)]|uniref:tyrosine--tRNA ligase n=1 Tax=Buchnera aphidicola TaxID=9 RepID=UPI0031B86560
MLNKIIINEFKKSGIIDKITDEKSFLEEIKKNKNITLYCGFDPTSDSLHIGHILPLLFLKKVQKYKNKIIILIGGATSLIGDPSFKDDERKLISKKNILKYQSKLFDQISYFLNKHFDIKNVKIINNYNWFNDMNILKFLRNVGKYFNIKNMIQKTSVKKRINRIDKNMSFTEFSYSLLQSYDFSYLYKNYNTILQVGGSDQWGNIVSGINLTKKLYNKKVFGITIPLFTKKNGKKFGKSEKGSIWLNKRKTSVFDFYQFWINISDEESNYFIKIFNFLDLFKKKIYNNTTTITYNIIKNKKLLADSITRFVHGYKDFCIVKKISKILFNKNFIKISNLNFIFLTKKYVGIPKFYINNKSTLEEILLKISFTNSLSNSRKIILSGSIKINNVVIKNCKHVFNKSEKKFYQYFLLSKGKKNFCVLQYEHIINLC